MRQARFERGGGEARRLSRRGCDVGLRLFAACTQRAGEDVRRFEEESLLARVVLAEGGGVERDCAEERALVGDGRDGQRAVAFEVRREVFGEVELGVGVEKRLEVDEAPGGGDET